MSSSIRKTIQKVMAIVLIAVMGISVVYAAANASAKVTLSPTSTGANSDSIKGGQVFIGSETKNEASSTQNMRCLDQYRKYAIGFYTSDKIVELAPGKAAAAHTSSSVLTVEANWRLRLEPKNPSAKGVTGAGRIYNY